MKTFRKLTALLVCALILTAAALPAFAEYDTGASILQEGEEGLLDSSKLDSIAADIASRFRLSPSDLSMSLWYSGTGEEWHSNADKWYYSASLYKVPMIMLYAEKEAAGELTQDSLIAGLSLAEAERLILENSNNDWAHTLMDNLGGDYTCRQMEKAFANLSDGYYSSDYDNYSYFTSRYMLNVLKTLYCNSESFPHVIEHLLLACPEAYFRRSLEGKYQIAQKYGTYRDYQDVTYNHAAGIIYTTRPFILVIMTENGGETDEISGYAAEAVTAYMETVESRYSSYMKSLQAERDAAEAEQRAAEEAEAAAAAAAEAEEAAQAKPQKTPEEIQQEREAYEREKAEKREEIEKLKAADGNSEPNAVEKLNEKLGFAPIKLLAGLTVIFILAAVVRTVTGKNRRV